MWYNRQKFEFLGAQMATFIVNVEESFIPAFQEFIKNSKDKIFVEKERFYTLEDYPIIQEIRKYAKANPKIYKQAKEEVEKEMGLI